MTLTRVGFMGAGQMGSPMVDRLAAAGTPVALYARRAEVITRFREAGVEVFLSPAAMASGAEVVIVCLYSEAQLREALVGPEGLLAVMDEGSVVAVHTTCSPGIMAELAAEAAPRGVAVVDAPVSGGADDIVAGRLTVMLGGDPDETARVAPVVAAYSDAVFETGPLGSAQAVKLINNTLFAANTQLVAEAERIGRALGADPVMLARVIQRSSGASYVMGLLEQLGSTDAFVGLAGHFIRKDVDVVNAVAADIGIDLGLLGEVANADAVDFGASRA